MSLNQADSCIGKVRYRSKTDADMIASIYLKQHNKMSKRKKRRVAHFGFEKVHGYKCRFCEYWHVGRRPNDATTDDELNARNARLQRLKQGLDAGRERIEVQADDATGVAHAE